MKTYENLSALQRSIPSKKTYAASLVRSGRWWTMSARLASPFPASTQGVPPPPPSGMSATLFRGKLFPLFYLGNLCTESGQTLQGSFSAVSKPHFASQYTFQSSRRDLHNTLLCTALKSHLCKKWQKQVAFDTAENEPCKACPLSVYRPARCRRRTFLQHRQSRSRRAAGRPSGAACANSSSTTGGIPKVEQTAPLRHGAAAWAWGF